MNEQEIKDKLTELALRRTTPFCYSCYKKCPSGTCQTCGSDDLMRHFEGVGVEYGLCRTLHKPYYPETKIMLSIH